MADLESLLRRTREYICGCRNDSVEPCYCEECEIATALLIEVDAALEEGDAL